MLREATQLDRFFQIPPPLTGVIQWGHHEDWVHNRLHLNALRPKQEGVGKPWWEVELLLPGVNFDTADWRYYREHLRWFRFGVTETAGRLVAFEEWLNYDSKTDHKRNVEKPKEWKLARETRCRCTIHIHGCHHTDIDL